MITLAFYRFFTLLGVTLCSVQAFSQQALADAVITKELLQAYVQVIAHDSMDGRLTGTEGCEKAGYWIAREMQAIGLQPMSNRSFHHPYRITNGMDTIKAANIVGIIPGSNAKKYIIFSAHYDHVGNAAKHKWEGQLHTDPNDLIFNGANDNASGVAAMLALARYFTALQANDFTLVFVAFSGEENGLVGSNVFVKKFGDLSRIRRVVNLEMLGRYTTDGTKPFVTEGYKSTGFLKKLNKYLLQADSTTKAGYFQKDPFVRDRYFYRSDNASFAYQGVPANTIMAGSDSDPFYHSPADEWQTLNYEAMTQAVRKIALACTVLVQK